MNESVVTGPQRGSDKTARIPIKVEAVAASCGPLVRSSYHADQQARAAGV